MKKKKTMKLIFEWLVLLLAFGFITISNGYSQTLVEINLSKTIAVDCSSCASGDSIDINDDGIFDLYVKIQQWQVVNGPHNYQANALLIWGAAGDSVAGGCVGGGTMKTLMPGDIINSNTDWDKLTHPFYIEPGMPWVCSCDGQQTVYIGLRFMTTEGEKYGYLKMTYTKTSYHIEEAYFMENNGQSITISNN